MIIAKMISPTYVLVLRSCPSELHSGGVILGRSLSFYKNSKEYLRFFKPHQKQ